MSLSAASCPRKPIHNRTISVQTYAREDGLWDLEAQLIDTKSYDFPKLSGEIHAAGDPVHHMHLRVTIDDKFNIIDAEVAYDAAPYGEFCSAIAPEYKNLVGLNLLNQFRRKVRESFGRTAGCTHVTELTNVLPTVAIQTMTARKREAPDNGQRPFQLDGCHALRLDGPAVKQYYSEWYEEPVSNNK